MTVRWPVELGARLLLATRIVDRGYRLFDAVRSELVAGLASEPLLERFNQLVYGTTSKYRSDSDTFRTELLPFEERIFDEFFPTPPARILVGGAGGGREAFALARMGYRVVAFDPSAPLAGTLAEGAGELPIQVYRAGYGDLPQLFPVRPGGPGAQLDELEPFDASIVGWGSFSHLVTEEVRLRLLTCFGEATNGPILVSFILLRTARTVGWRGRVRERLPRRPERESADRFSIHIGYYRAVDRAELEHLAAKAGLEVRYVNFDEREMNWPHAVLGRRAPEEPASGERERGRRGD